MEISNQKPLQKDILKLFYMGGLQKHIPRDETQAYLNNMMLDAIRFCVKDFKSSTPSNTEKTCIKNVINKNFKLLGE